MLDEFFLVCTELVTDIQSKAGEVTKEACKSNQLISNKISVTSPWQLRLKSSLTARRIAQISLKSALRF